MMRLLKLTVVLCVLAVSSCAHNKPSKNQSSEPEEVKAVVEQFYTMDAAGRWLGPERWQELQDFLTEAPPWSPPWTLRVLKSYRVGYPRRDIGAGGMVDYQVEVDCQVWGSIDSLLHFTRAQAPPREKPAAGGPIQERTYESLVLTDRFRERRESGKEEEKKGSLRWKMNTRRAPNVDVETALRFVAERRDKSNDPVTKYNAERTLAALRSLLTGAPSPVPPVGSAQQSPSAVARQFFGLETRSGPDQWGDLAKFFLETPQPQWNTIHIVDVVGIAAGTEGNEAHQDTSEVEIFANSLGDLDSSLRLSNYPSIRLLPNSASACYGDDRFGYTLLLSDRHWEIATDGAVRELRGPLAWRLEYSIFDPLITLDTAIRYVTERRDKSADPVIKKNAERTLIILKKYKRGEPLPSNLCFDSGGGCGG
jgi:hypothetical protein